MSRKEENEQMKALRGKAAELENDVEQHLVDNNGLLLSALDIDTMKPFPRGYFEGMNILNYPGHTWTDFSEFMTYENVGMCTGAYLAAMVWKYRATKDPAALAKASRTFNGIKWLFDISQETAEGFYCKCHGGKLTEQISSDQYIYTFAGLNEFMAVAGHEERSQCLEMIEKMVKFWMRINYSYPYYGKPLAWPIERFPVFPWLAYHHTGKQEFLDEFNRLCAIPEVMAKIPFGNSYEDMLAAQRTRGAHFDFERNSPLRHFSPIPETTESGFLSLEALLEYNAPHREAWLAKARKLLECNLPFIADDGYAMCSWLYNIESGDVSELRERLCCPEGKSEKWKFGGGLVCCLRSGMQSAMFARACVALQRYFPDTNALATARHVLENLSHDKMRWFADIDGKQFPDDLKWMDKVYSGDAVTHWLWAYWEAAAKYGAPENCPRIDTN